MHRAREGRHKLFPGCRRGAQVQTGGHKEIWDESQGQGFDLAIFFYGAMEESLSLGGGAGGSSWCQQVIYVARPLVFFPEGVLTSFPSLLHICIHFFSSAGFETRQIHDEKRQVHVPGLYL